MSAGKAWSPIATVRSQQEVLVCNMAYLGWWDVAIQNALGEWHSAGSRYETTLRHKPTHWQALPSILTLRTGSGTA
jgi:hypothetical protein